MIKITIKYEDEVTPRVIQISDTNIQNEQEFVKWTLNSMWDDCYMDENLKSEFYIEHEWLCSEYFDVFYKGYNIFDWYSVASGWIRSDESYINIETTV